MGSFLNQEELGRICTLLKVKKLEVSLRPTWASGSPGYREDIHGELKIKMGKAYPLCDASISHCHVIGGFAFITYDYDHVLQLGFDLEEIGRVTPEVARRACKTEQEFLEAPSPSSLWTAKEAAFKCLKGPSQPKTISEVQFKDWQILDSHIETVCLKDPQKFKFSSVCGVIYKKNNLSLCFFISLP